MTLVQCGPSGQAGLKVVPQPGHNTQLQWPQLRWSQGQSWSQSSHGLTHLPTVASAGTVGTLQAGMEQNIMYHLFPARQGLWGGELLCACILDDPPQVCYYPTGAEPAV